MKTLKGKVVSLKMHNTAIVEVVRHYPHSLYKKVMTRSKRYKADLNGIKLDAGENVEIISTAPLSKDKHFKIVKKLT